MNKAKKIIIVIAATIGLAGCVPWQARTVYNVGIWGDEEKVEEQCSGTVFVGQGGQFYCDYGTGTRWSPAIPGDAEHADAECNGTVVTVGAYFACVKP